MISQGGFTPDFLYCRDLVERHDYERYVLCMGAPAAKRPALLVLSAFYFEIAKTRDVASGMAGHLRLTWWEDAIKKGSREHEVLRALDGMNIPNDVLLNIIAARRPDIDGAPPADLSAHMGAQVLPLLQGYAHVLEVQGDFTHLATAYGLTGFLRALSYNISKGHKVLPEGMMARLNSHSAQISHLKPSDELRALCGDIAHTAEAHLNAAGVQNTRVFTWLVRVIHIYLGRMQACDYEAFSPQFSGAVPFLGMRILFKGPRG